MSVCVYYCEPLCVQQVKCVTFSAQPSIRFYPDSTSRSFHIVFRRLLMLILLKLSFLSRNMPAAVDLSWLGFKHLSNPNFKFCFARPVSNVFLNLDLGFGTSELPVNSIFPLCESKDRNREFGRCVYVGVLIH